MPLVVWALQWGLWQAVWVPDAAHEALRDLVRAREAAKTLSASRHVVFRGQGHGVVVQDACAARLRDAFIDDPDPKRALPCRPDTPPNFTAAYERARSLP